MIYLQLFWEFLKTGLFAVGGGLATLPFLYEVSDKTGWFTHGDLMNMLAVAESTPGPIGVNVATYVGFTTAGVLGSIVATFGLALPSLTIILIIAGFLKAFRENKYVDSAFYGLRPASTAMIAASGLSVAAACLLNLSAWTGEIVSVVNVLNWKGLILALAVYVGSNHVKLTKDLHPIWFIAASAVVGILFKFA